MKKSKKIVVMVFDKMGCESHRLNLGLTKPLEYNDSTDNNRRESKKKVIEFLRKQKVFNEKDNMCITIGTTEPFSFLVTR